MELEVQLYVNLAFLPVRNVQHQPPPATVVSMTILSQEPPVLFAREEHIYLMILLLLFAWAATPLVRLALELQLSAQPALTTISSLPLLHV
jgi:hypothetical protein